ncbi:bifunctional 2-polyprenyl-6-hydroxyphenol methylase/3-demethylubiquinol 3-O-methyltransferase UbiG [Blastococcus sp. LR1]|uniref:class I SAM-dependent methyltransferase n=1 Tax=Blastococcus sp. LR1 TaxID=2877000 RepID=UPI001CCDD122|nr:class I SAM-dependent methyltransferase [Blastococcus sp. LR1]MCA0144983.1 class I SAM-dependent methyltransferase [Blastococcus sp. LR1]
MSDDGPRGWGAPLYETVLDATAVGEGTRLLDLGCGAGLFARAAADRGALVTGVDLDDGAVAQAAAEVPEGTFLVRHAQDPPRGPFDVVAAVQLLMHVADPVAVLRRAGRGGELVAATVWGRDDECDLRVLQEALAPRRPGRGPAVSEPARLRAMAERAGLVVERLDEVVVPFEYADEDALLEPLLATPVARTATRTTDPESLRNSVLEAVEPFATGDGGYRLENLFRVLVARPR